MTHRSIRLALCVLGLAALGREAGAQTRALDPDPSLGVAGATTPTTTAVAPHDGHHAPAALPVPPELEIQVLDPNVDPLGNPAVLTRTDPTGRVVVDIPPVVLVHRYYYSGDRSFQGPLLPGGPTILVANHPKTGERTYLQVTMLPGAPRVTYSANAIVYDFGPQSMTLTFGRCGKPTVTYRQGLTATEKLRAAHDEHRRNFHDLVDRTGLPEARIKVRAVSRNVVETAADRTRSVARAAVTPVIQILRVTPLGSALTSTAEQRAIHERDEGIRQAEARSNALEGDIKTLR